MGNMLYAKKCAWCGCTESLDNPIMTIHSRGKYDQLHICYKCIRKKIETINKYEKRVRQIP